MSHSTRLIVTPVATVMQVARRRLDADAAIFFSCQQSPTWFLVLFYTRSAIMSQTASRRVVPCRTLQPSHPSPPPGMGRNNNISRARGHPSSAHSSVQCELLKSCSSLVSARGLLLRPRILQEHCDCGVGLSLIWNPTTDQADAYPRSATVEHPCNYLVTATDRLSSPKPRT